MKYETIELAKSLARELRKRQTRAEGILWEALRNRRFFGKKFLRQHPSFFEDSAGDGFFIADFYCHEHRLAVELDGKSHINQHEYDGLRTGVMNGLRMSVIRFKTEEIESELEYVVEKLRKVLTQPPVPPSLSKRRGGSTTS